MSPGALPSRGLVSSWYVISIDTGHIAQSPQSGPRWSPAFKMEPVLFPTSLGRKVMTNLDGILKSRDITLPTKVHLVKAMAFPVVMYRCESWTIK